MAAALFALVAAVVVALVYVALAERLDYVTVHRRQLDVWVALAAVSCLAGILYGATQARRQIVRWGDDRRRPTPVVVRRQELAPRTAQVEGEEEGESRPAEQQGEPAEQQPLSGAAPPAGGRRAQATPPPGPSAGALASGQRGLVLTHLPTPRVAEMLVATAVQPAPTAGPSATLPPISLPTYLPSPFVPPTIQATRLAPTAVPTLEPSPTPHCGDPDKVRLRVERLDTSLDRSGRDLVVHYRAQVRNESDFPATMADIVVTALNHAAGSEQFGHTTRPDVALAPGAVIVLEGAITLTKTPPPFGTTDVCLTAVAETCGRRPPYRVIRQCTTVRGF